MSGASRRALRYARPVRTRILVSQNRTSIVLFADSVAVTPVWPSNQPTSVRHSRREHAIFQTAEGSSELTYLIGSAKLPRYFVSRKFQRRCSSAKLALSTSTVTDKLA